MVEKREGEPKNALGLFRESIGAALGSTRRPNILEYELLTPAKMVGPDFWRGLRAGPSSVEKRLRARDSLGEAQALRFSSPKRSVGGGGKILSGAQ